MGVIFTRDLRLSQRRGFSHGLLGCDAVQCCGRIPTFRGLTALEK